MRTLRPALLVLLAALLTAPAAALAAPTPVVPSAETVARFDDEADANADADDPAVWVDEARPERSLIVGTLKNGGLTVFDLSGATVQDIATPPAPGPESPSGRFNNVEVRQDVRIGGLRGDFAITTDRGRDQLRTYRIAPGSRWPPLTDVTTPRPPFVFSRSQDEVDTQTTAYGLASFEDRRHGDVFVLVSRRSRTEVALLRLKPGPHRTVSYTEVDRLALPSSFRLPDGTKWAPCEDPGDLPQVEGMVVDEQRGVAYLGQEDVGIWRVPVTSKGFAGRPALIERVREYGVPGAFDPEEEECVLDEAADPGFGGAHVSADVEGLTLSRNLLVVSSQGDNTFAAFANRGLGSFAGSFAIVASGAIDGVQESDGALVVDRPLGPRFPRGLLVTQDGDEEPGVAGRGDATNFKLTRWERVLEALGL